MEPKDDDDDDVSFAKWMSSFWGHNWVEESERGLRDHRRRSQDAGYRKTSLPCPFSELPRITSSDSHSRRHSHEDQGFGCHTHVGDFRKCSKDESFKEPLDSKGRSHSKIQAFPESSDHPVCFKTKRSVSLGHESRKERKEREGLMVETRSRKKVEERSSRKEEARGASKPR
ncbi:leukemia NUP98 fusion partner 1 [Sorex araneus]|uniref:leukemia NUP98 fusion partner 1 n=1 Tax=Sorex araneus TaxID=42254 RepID=UPI002433ADFE|nr:leukemia NUP98 fusion partner 1 [Sorex araneus]XP_054982469.1 leukemia NUP98 fusion partner 1 [Sorex araneus]